MSGAITNTSGTNTPAPATNRTGIGADFNTFLTLLTTQLRNQDPTNAMDPQEMTQQLVQFASVEQQLKVNTNLETLISVQQGSQLVSAAPLMGRMVEVESDQLSLQNGVAALRLPAAGAAAYGFIQVQDSAGRVVATSEGALGAAQTTWQWNGRNLSGEQLPDGAYKYVIAGARADGTQVELTAGVLARATGVDRQDGKVRLNLGAISVDFDKVRGLDGS
ncbi:MAG: flagellar biosynthesis protein FlgD [Rubritepida sp.]|nr:flagellar biosynthesis protein FlgD [Rubritepida sp.]